MSPSRALSHAPLLGSSLFLAEPCSRMNTDGNEEKAAAAGVLGPLGPAIFVETQTSKIFKLQRSGIGTSIGVHSSQFHRKQRGCASEVA